jgi:integrase
MPLREWPANDRELWLGAVSNGDILDGGGARAKIRTASNRKMQQGYGRFLTFAERIGLPDGCVSALPIIQKHMVVQYVAELRELGNSSGTVLGRLQELHDVVRAMMPKRDWSWIRSIASRVRSTHSPAIEKRKRMVGTEDLLTLGHKLMHSAGAKRSAPGMAIEFRDGLMIALLSLRPLRLRNLAALELDRTLYRQATTFRIAFEADEVKNGSPLAFEWPGSLLGPLREWLDVHRSVLARLNRRWAREIGAALWVSSHGSPMTKQAIYDRITKRTRKAFGAAINPHLFRDIAATTLAIADPKHVRIAAPLLGHATFATTERYYLQAHMVEAASRYQEELLMLRNHLRKIRV